MTKAQRVSMATLVWIGILFAVAVLIVTVYVFQALGILPSFPHQLPVAWQSLGREVRAVNEKNAGPFSLHAQLGTESDGRGLSPHDCG